MTHLSRLLLFLCCFHAIGSIAQPVQTKYKVATDSVYSTTLQAWRSYNILTPPGFDSQADVTYPVLFLLHGLTDDHRAWVEKGRVKDVADRLSTSGEMQPMVIVMPCAGGQNVHQTWNGYFDMEGWTYETFFTKEFIPYIEKNYRCGGKKSLRALAGLSMGGGGSIVYAQRHPDDFCAVYAMSSWLHNDSLQHAPRGKMETLMQAVHQHSALNFMQQINREQQKQLRNIAWFIDCGDDDYLFDHSIRFYRALRQGGIPAQLRVRDGGHDWEYWHTALYQCLPFVSRNLHP